jgi:hypothetical protein
VPEATQPAEKLAEARLSLQPAPRATHTLTDRACLPLGLSTMLRPDLQETAAASQQGALQHKRVLSSSKLPYVPATRLPSQLLSSRAVACTAAASHAAPRPRHSPILRRYCAWQGPRPHGPEVMNAFCRGRAAESNFHGDLAAGHLLHLCLAKPLAQRQGRHSGISIFTAAVFRSPFAGWRCTGPLPLLPLGPQPAGQGRCLPPPLL